MTTSRRSASLASIVGAGIVGVCTWVLPLSTADAAPYPPIPTTVNVPQDGPVIPPPGAVVPVPTAAVAAAGGVQGLPGGILAPGAFPVQAPTGAGPAEESDHSDVVTFGVAAGLASIMTVAAAMFRRQRVGRRR